MRKFSLKKFEDQIDKSGLSKREIQKFFGVKRSSLLMYLKGDVKPGADNLGKIATACGCKIDDFYEDIGGSENVSK